MNGELLPKGMTPLTAASYTQKANIVGLLLFERDADPTKHDERGYNPLYYAVIPGNERVKTLLMKKIEKDWEKGIGDPQPNRD